MTGFQPYEHDMVGWFDRKHNRLREGTVIEAFDRQGVCIVEFHDDGDMEIRNIKTKDLSYMCPATFRPDIGEGVNYKDPCTGVTYYGTVSSRVFGPPMWCVVEFIEMTKTRRRVILLQNLVPIA